MRALRFILVLVAGLALLAWGALVAVQRTTRDWFDRDIQLRAGLAVSGAREALVAHWGDGQRAGVLDVLLAITRDERIMAAVACDADLKLLAQAGDHPAQLSCPAVGPHVRPSAGSPDCRYR